MAEIPGVYAQFRIYRAFYSESKVLRSEEGKGYQQQVAESCLQFPINWRNGTPEYQTYASSRLGRYLFLASAAKRDGVYSVYGYMSLRAGG